MITVIITYYNTPYDQLKQAVDSVLNQTFSKIQFLLVDDGSQRHYEFEGVEQITLDHNVGQAEAQNIALSYARGEYLYFMDADDYIYRRTLELLMRTLIDTNADIAVGRYTQKADDNLGSGSDKPIIFDKRQVLMEICGFPFRAFNVTFNTVWNKLYRRKLFDDIKFPTGLTHNDTFTTHKLVWKAESIALLPMITYYYRFGGQIAGRNLYKTKDLILAHQARLQFLEEVVQDAELIRNEKGLLLYTMYRTYMEIKDETIKEDIQQLREEIKGMMNERDFIVR